jgi:multidrug efflux pump subunit AcrA (membrane-fusion protein)
MLSSQNPEFIRPVSSEEFLPPLGAWTTLGGLVMIGTLAAGIALAGVTRYNVIIKAEASVRPTGEIRLVQAATEGTVKNIAVKENQVVKQGDIIATIDNSQVQSKKSQLLGNIQQSQLQLVQIDAQIRALDGQIAAETNRSQGAVASAEAELRRNHREYQERKVTATTELQEAEANIKIAEGELLQADSELKSALAKVKATEAGYQAAIRKRNRYQSIAESGSISQNQLEEAQLEAEQQQQTLLSQKAVAESQKQVIQKQQQSIKAAIAKRERAFAALNPSNAMVTMVTEKINQEQATGEVGLARLKQEQKSLLQQKIEIQNRINNSQKEIQQLELEQQKTVITSPESGTILKLELRNLGQVVRSGEAIAQITPNNAALIIKARLQAEDVSNVQVCKAVKVADCQQGKVQMRISAYPYPDYGILKGAVRAITSDVISPQNNNSSVAPSVAPYYEVTIEPEKAYLEKNNQQYPIQPGMEITADIISKEDTLLKFIFRKAKLLTDF